MPADLKAAHDEVGPRLAAHGPVGSPAVEDTLRDFGLDPDEFGTIVAEAAIDSITDAIEETGGAIELASTVAAAIAEGFLWATIYHERKAAGE